jgi:hypothetical protein
VEISTYFPGASELHAKKININWNVEITFHLLKRFDRIACHVIEGPVRIVCHVLERYAVYPQVYLSSTYVHNLNIILTFILYDMDPSKTWNAVQTFHFIFIFLACDSDAPEK